VSVITGVIQSGGKNVFSVLPADGGGVPVDCRIKGKHLGDRRAGEAGRAGRFYNPLAPGDLVECDTDARLILSRKRRTNFLARFNTKRAAPQVMAANIDVLLVLTSPASPPFRPRFIDRALVQAAVSGIPALVLCNKSDLGIPPPVRARFASFEDAGYQVIYVSQSGQGLERLLSILAGKRAALLGQSGVGKSSLINALLPGKDLKTASLNSKWDRGNHTTARGLLVEGWCGKNYLSLIDTPGIRDFIPCDPKTLAPLKPAVLSSCFPEFDALSSKCQYGASCTHDHEPVCAVRDALNSGWLSMARYESYLRLRKELSQP